jgi:hypothetical protein
VKPETDALYFSERRLWEDGDKQTREVLERLARYRASLDRTVNELAALRKGLQDEVKFCRSSPSPSNWQWADRLQALLDSSRGEK